MFSEVFGPNRTGQENAIYSKRTYSITIPYEVFGPKRTGHKRWEEEASGTARLGLEGSLSELLRLDDACCGAADMYAYAFARGRERKGIEGKAA